MKKSTVAVAKQYLHNAGRDWRPEVSVKMTTRAAMASLTVVVLLLSLPAQAGDNIGKVFITVAPPDADGFVDSTLENSVKDLTNRAGDFEVVANEDDADFLMVVVSREEQVVSGQPKSKRLTVTLSVRDGKDWKPGIKIVKVHSVAWGNAARAVMGDAHKWVKGRAKD
jgi:hypothetical protein